MNQPWYNDKRIQMLDGEKRAFLLSFLGNNQNMSKEEVLSAYLRMNQEMKKKNLSFSPKEQAHLKDVLIEQMPTKEQKRIRQMISMLSL